MLVVAYVYIEKEPNTQKKNQKQKYQILALVPSQEGLPWWLMGKESACQCKRHGFDPWVKKIPWRGKWQPRPVFLPGKSHGQRSLADCHPQGHKESDTTLQLSTHLLGRKRDLEVNEGEHSHFSKYSLLFKYFIMRINSYNTCIIKEQRIKLLYQDITF